MHNVVLGPDLRGPGPHPQANEGDYKCKRGAQHENSYEPSTEMGRTCHG